MIGLRHVQMKLRILLHGLGHRLIPGLHRITGRRMKNRQLMKPKRLDAVAGTGTKKTPLALLTLKQTMEELRCQVLRQNFLQRGLRLWRPSQPAAKNPGRLSPFEETRRSALRGSGQPCGMVQG